MALLLTRLPKLENNGSILPGRMAKEYGSGCIAALKQTRRLSARIRPHAGYADVEENVRGVELVGAWRDRPREEPDLRRYARRCHGHALVVLEGRESLTPARISL
jgi:hypothetical protein